MSDAKIDDFDEWATNLALYFAKHGGHDLHRRIETLTAGRLPPSELDRMVEAVERCLQEPS